MAVYYYVSDVFGVGFAGAWPRYSGYGFDEFSSYALEYPSAGQAGEEVGGIRMLDFFAQFSDAFTVLFHMLGSFLQSFIDFLQRLPVWLSFLQTSVFYLPHLVAPFILAGLFLTVLFFILGRT